MTTKTMALHLSDAIRALEALAPEKQHAAMRAILAQCPDGTFESACPELTADAAIATYARAACAYVDGEVSDIAGIIEQIGLRTGLAFDDVVEAQMKVYPAPEPEDQSDATMSEIIATQEVAYRVGVAVGRSLRGAR